MVAAVRCAGISVAAPGQGFNSGTTGKKLATPAIPRRQPQTRRENPLDEPSTLQSDYLIRRGNNCSTTELIFSLPIHWSNKL
jgi:hypothetical protein